ncbi:hypothetical protein OIU76_027913 [Salix suchowensis]|nr:hypothetical protein OIU76_027913 [Salix suchowensis]
MPKTPAPLQSTRPSRSRRRGRHENSSDEESHQPLLCRLPCAASKTAAFRNDEYDGGEEDEYEVTSEEDSDDTFHYAERSFYSFSLQILCFLSTIICSVLLFGNPGVLYRYCLVRQLFVVAFCFKGAGHTASKTSSKLLV